MLRAFVYELFESYAAGTAVVVAVGPAHADACMCRYLGDIDIIDDERAVAIHNAYRAFMQQDPRCVPVTLDSSDGSRITDENYTEFLSRLYQLYPATRELRLEELNEGYSNERRLDWCIGRITRSLPEGWYPVISFVVADDTPVGVLSHTAHSG